MPNGNLITDYISAASGAPGTPSLGDTAAEAAIRYRTDAGMLQVWDGSAWQTPPAGLRVHTVTANYQMLDTDDVIVVDGTGITGDITVTLPSFSASVKQRLIYPAISPSGNIIVAAHGTDKVQDLLNASPEQSSVVIQGSGTSWLYGMPWGFANVPTVFGSHADWTPSGGPAANMGNTGQWGGFDWQDSPRSLYQEILLLENAVIAGGLIFHQRTAGSTLPATTDLTSGLTTSAPFTLTMPNPAITHKLVIVKSHSSSTFPVTVGPFASETFDLAPSYILARPGQAVALASDGFDWHIVAEFAGVDSLQSGNPRYPWPAGSASDWRAANGATPGAWTLDSGLSVAYPPNGLGKITWTNDSTARKLVVDLPGTTEFDVVMRIQGVEDQPQALAVNAGFSAVGDQTDMSGIFIGWSGVIRALVAGSTVGGNHVWSGQGLADGFVSYWLHLAGGTFSAYMSRDGLVYNLIHQAASGLTATKFAMVVEPASVTDGEMAIWLDFIAFGNTTPAGQ